MNAFKVTLREYCSWFSPIMKYLIEGFVAQIRQAMERAVEDDNEVRHASVLVVEKCRWYFS